MKKTKILALALIVAVVLTGAGYAAWSTKITYNNNMKTAEWNVFVENDALGDSLVASDKVDNFNSNGTVTGIPSTDGYNQYDTKNSADISGANKVNGTNYVYTIEPTITSKIEKDDTVNFAFYNMHPGTSATTRFEIRNKGSIPAKIADVKVIINDGKALNAQQKALCDAMVVSGQFFDHIGSNPATPIIGSNFSDKHLYELESTLEGFLLKYQLKEQHSITTLDGSEIEVNPGLTFSIPASALKVGDKNVGRLAQLNVKIEFTFVQYNQNTPDVI